MLSHSFFQDLTIGIAFLNDKKEITNVNTTFEKILCKSKAYLLKQKITNFIPSFDKDVNESIEEELQELNSVLLCDGQNTSTINFIIHVSLIAIDDDINYVLFIDKKKHDNTQLQIRTTELYKAILLQIITKIRFKKQKRETELVGFQAVENQLLFTSIAKHFPNGMIVVIDKNNKIVFVEGRDFEKLNLDSKSFKDAIFDDIQLSVDRIARGKHYIKQTLEGAELTLEVFFKGQVYTLNSMPLYDENHQISQALFVYTNITKQKNIEKNTLKALVKEKELNELKSRFVSMASHEFRTPLSVIISAANLLQRQNKIGLEEKHQKNIHRIKSNVKILENILSDFLSITKIEEGIIQPEYIVFNVLELMNKLIEDADIYKKEGQCINLDAIGSDFSVRLDKQFLTIIISNLLSNAIKYSLENKKIKITLKLSEEFLIIAIEDEGIGIPDEDKQYLFTRFFRAKNAINIKGNGLGLYILKQYVNLMNGVISVESTLQKGSLFIVKLPYK